MSAVPFSLRQWLNTIKLATMRVSNACVSAVCVVCIAVWHRMLDAHSLRLLFVVGGGAFIIAYKQRGDAKWAVFLVPNSSPFILGTRRAGPRLWHIKARTARVPKVHCSVNSTASPNTNALANRETLSANSILCVRSVFCRSLYVMFVSCGWQPHLYWFATEMCVWAPKNSMFYKWIYYCNSPDCST